MLSKSSLIVLALGTIVFVGTITMPNHVFAITNQVLPRGLAEFNILDFTQTRATWSLRVTIDGNHTHDMLAIQTDDSTILEYYAQYDKNLDATTIKKTYVSQFTSISGRFPDEQWILRLLFAVNVSLVNLPVGDFSMQLPTINYEGVLFISSSQTEGFSDLGRYGNVYSLVAYISRSAGVASQLRSSMIIFPFVLSIFAWILAAVIPMDIVFLLLRTNRRWSILSRRPVRFARSIAQRCHHLLDGKYFTIVIGVLFFLPIYEITLRSLEAPIPITQGDLVLISQASTYAWILIISFIVSLITSREE